MFLLVDCTQGPKLGRVIQMSAGIVIFVIVVHAVRIVQCTTTT